MGVYKGTSSVSLLVLLRGRKVPEGVVRGKPKETSSTHTECRTFETEYMGGVPIPH